MSKVGNFIIEVQEFVWDFFDENGNFVVMIWSNQRGFDDSYQNKVWYYGVDVAKDEIFAIETERPF